MALKKQGKFDDAKAKLLDIQNLLKKGGIPPNNDLKIQIANCTTIAFFNLSDNKMQFESKGGEPKTVTVKTNSKTFTVKSDSKWCKPGKTGSSTVTVRCDDNDEFSPRSAKVFVTADGKTSYFDVIQERAKLELALQPEEVEFPSEGSTVTVSVTTNAPSWDVKELPFWVDYEKLANQLILKSKKNEVVRPREATMYVEADDESFPLVLRQAASDPMVSVDKERLDFSSSASEKSFTIKSNLENLEFKISDEWIEVSRNLDQVIVKVKQNDLADSRQGWVSIGKDAKECKVIVNQEAAELPPPEVGAEIPKDESVDKEPKRHEVVAVNSWPSHLKVLVKDSQGMVKKEYTPFELHVDDDHYTVTMGFESRDLNTNQKQEVYFKPGFRFAAFTWAPKTAIGVMSGFVGSGSWGVYGHFQATTPIVTSYLLTIREIAGYNMTLGPVYCPQEFPYIGAYAGIGAGAYVCTPHYGFDYEAGVMGFYKNMTLTMGFHSSRVSSTNKNTSFNIGFGGYLKRYYDDYYGYCSSDSRRWLSLNYVFRPSENGKGLMVGDIGRGYVRPYIKAVYISPDSIELKTARDIEEGAGLVFTPFSGIIDLCAGASVRFNIEGKTEMYQGIGAELGAIVNVWRFPITVIMHQTDVFGEPRLCVDFGIGIHLGKFSKEESTYQ